MIAAPKPVDEVGLTREAREGLAATQLLEALAPYFDLCERAVLDELGSVKCADKNALYHVRCRLEGLREARALMQRVIRRGDAARKRLSLYRRAVETWERVRGRHAA